MISADSNIVVTMGAAHIRRIDRASTRRIRQMTQTAFTIACDRARAQSATPLSAVDDLSIHVIGPWIDAFAKCLARSAKREGVSVVGGEMAQVPDTYAPGYASIVVTVVSLRETEGGR